MGYVESDDIRSNIRVDTVIMVIHIHFVIRVIKGYQACLGLQVIRKLEN